MGSRHTPPGAVRTSPQQEALLKHLATASRHRLRPSWCQLVFQVSLPEMLARDDACGAYSLFTPRQGGADSSPPTVRGIATWDSARGETRLIEYVTAAWNPYTGCLNGEAECPVYAQCWARDMSHRFQAACGGNFKPRFHPQRLDQPLHWRKPRHVAVCFMGDLWGTWEDAIDGDHPGCTVPMKWVRESIVDIVRQCPQHIFLFLTKAPEQYAEIEVWPANALVGVTLTGAEPPKRQAAMLEALQRVQEPSMKWLSYEPAMAPLAQPIPSWLDWVVVGGWSGGHHPITAAAYSGVLAVNLQCDACDIPRWEKSNLSGMLEAPLHQELPSRSPNPGMLW